MFEQILQQLKLMLSNYNLTYGRVNDRLSYFESVKYNFAFDIVLEKNTISIDFVYRRGTINKEFILKKYPHIEKNKCRLLSIAITTHPELLYRFIKDEYLELVYNYENMTPRNIYSIDKDKKLIVSEPLKFWFADGIPNFGDFMTPWLASHFTNRPILNVRNIASSEGAILGVGSIVQAYGPNHKKVKVWGSGIISADDHLATANKLKKAQLDYVYACRGELTKKFFETYNFECSNVLGDPGLLFGNLYKPKSKKIYKYAIVPHYIHYKFFKDLEIEGCVIVDVRNELTSVIDEITSAEKCVSTSMHGLIVAQSYNIPWLHLYIGDGRLLMGEDFKFHDFFSILDTNHVAQKKVSMSDIDKDFILKCFNEASLPKFRNNYSEQALIESFYDCLEDKKPKQKFTLNNKNLPTLLFMGDSHIGYFKFGAQSGLYAPFETAVCMASGATASGLGNLNSFTRATEKFKEFLSKYPKESEVIIQLGEVDCGILIWLKSQQNNVSPEKQLHTSLCAYEKFLKELKDDGFLNITVTSATLPTINDEDHIGEIISLRRQKVTANFRERTDLTYKFNDLLKTICTKLNINFIDATSYFIDSASNLCHERFRNPDQGDHHMDNLEASNIWARCINEYLFDKYNPSLSKVKLICAQDTYLKKFKIHSNKLKPSNLFRVYKGDVIVADKYFHDSNYLFIKNVEVNGKELDSEFKFLHLSHFSTL